ncbi:DUF3035 domain-containing protein [Caldovatus aquaticus]|uniref:DUF3035 domain-containing protein n=1 Tax=Caldovatus aquaticus TaxID=2865671 RepID=A0ABS7EY31_9PROT|nr:DUF3035 domain-containing protein [Caldovatus aquaticus]MBW8268262.1 DUF3035 domain-containing protein [Caldovatus aquaticus]
MRQRSPRPAGTRCGALVAFALAAGLAGCGSDTARTLGFTRDAPDEFAVTTRAPLSMPPDMTELPPPRPGARRPQELSIREQAEAALVPGAALGSPAAAGRPSPGEAALVAQTGRSVPPDIRRRVDEEALRLEQPDRPFVDRLMFWRQPPPPGTPVDAEREAQRLRENAALGRSPTEGETPIIQPRRRGLLEGLF